MRDAGGGAERRNGKVGKKERERVSGAVTSFRSSAFFFAPLLRAPQVTHTLTHHVCLGNHSEARCVSYRASVEKRWSSLHATQTAQMPRARRKRRLGSVAALTLPSLTRPLSRSFPLPTHLPGSKEGVPFVPPPEGGRLHVSQVKKRRGGDRKETERVGKRMGAAASTPSHHSLSIAPLSPSLSPGHARRRRHVHRHHHLLPPGRHAGRGGSRRPRRLH